ncbi:hypothetical protein BBP40_005225 [Aspergillus hancockii]|nr:hypothetical protein BBP40_005225 [Aspergillus hancockii]
MPPSIHPSHRRPSRLSRPVRASRTQVQSYHEETSSEDRDEDFESDDEQLRRLSLSLRPRDSNRMPVSYREDSTDDGFEWSLTDEDLEAPVPAEAPTRSSYPSSEPSNHRNPERPPRKRTVATRSQTKRSKRVSTKKRLELGRPLNKRRKVEEDVVPFVGSGDIPPWQTLPYQILFDIFYSAAYPLVDERTATRNSSVQWLVNASLLCRAFHEPALAALYHCPPLLPPAKAHSLLHLLSKPQESLSTNYINKIRELHIDAEALLLCKSGPLGYFELPRLIEKAPQLKILRLYHSHDYIVGLPLWQRTKWVYPESLFTSLISSSIRLRGWDWNSRFMETKRLLPSMMEKHLRPAFNGLRELRLLHIASKDSDGDDAEGSNEREVVLAMALKELPELCRLEFLECSIVNEHLLPHLPSTLTSLTINNCDEVTTANFSAFLASHGQHLRELSLSHNRHLSMSFIVGLAQSCWKLEKFKMDISIHDLSSYHDVEPHFRELLSASEVPTWPVTLQDIELIQLRKWDDTTAHVFFTSLIDAAPDLHNLRRLVISAILKIGWRDRASFREKWIGRLEKVFLRHSAAPNPTLSTIPPVSKRLAPVKSAESAAVDDVPAQSDVPGSGLSTPSKRKSARLAERKLFEVEDDVGCTPHSAVPDSDDDQKALTVQGMCDVVMVRIDNQRPSETQFNEEDFLDDEVSGDEDWNGVDMDAGDTSHAW